VTARFETRSTFEVPAARLFALVTDPDYQVRRLRLAGKDEVEARRDEGPDGGLTVTIEIWEPAVFGGGKSHRTMVMRYPPNSMRADWRQTIHGQEQRVRSWGHTEVRALAPTRCSLITSGTLELDIPVVGRAIERQVKAALIRQAEREATWTRRELEI